MRPPRERLKGECHPSDRTGEIKKKCANIFQLKLGVLNAFDDVAWVKLSLNVA